MLHILCHIKCMNPLDPIGNNEKISILRNSFSSRSCTLRYTVGHGTLYIEVHSSGCRAQYGVHRRTVHIEVQFASPLFCV